MNKTDVNLGEEVQVRTFLGKDKTIVGRLSDGRIILFGKDNPYLNFLHENQIVNCHVVYVHEKYIIVEPISGPSLQDSEQFVTDEIQEEPPLRARRRLGGYGNNSESTTADHSATKSHNPED